MGWLERKLEEIVAVESEEMHCGMKSVKFWHKREFSFYLRRRLENLTTCFQTRSSGKDHPSSRNLRQSGSEEQIFGNLGELTFGLKSECQLWSHLVEVDKVDIERLVRLARLQ